MIVLPLQGKMGVAVVNHIVHVVENGQPGVPVAVGRYPQKRQRVARPQGGAKAGRKRSAYTPTTWGMMPMRAR